MKINFFLYPVLLLAIILLFDSCRKKDNNPAPAKSKRDVKYEITGNYTGKINIVTSTNTGELVTYNEVSVPWTKEIIYPNNVMGAGIGGNTSSNGFGLPGQTITLKIYSGGNLIYTENVAADANGILGFPTYAFVF